MNGRNIARNMIARMAKESLRASPMRNGFVMITIALASALLAGVFLFAAGRKQQEKRELSHRQQVSYYNLTKEQAGKLQKDERIAYQIQVKTGILSRMEGFDVMPCYASALTDEIRVGELERGSLPKEGQEIAVYAAMLEKMGVEPVLGGSVALSFYDGSEETFTVSGILKGSERAKQFPVFFSETYAEEGSQLKAQPYEVYAKLYGAAKMQPEELREAMYRIGGDAGIEREYVNPSRAFLDSLSVNVRSAMIYALAGTVILLACILVIYGVFYLFVIGRIHQFGQLRTLGMTKKQIQKFVSQEGNALFLRAAPAGLAMGGAAGYFMVPGGFSFWNTLWILAAVFVIVLLVTRISLRKPACLAGAVSPVEALRYVPQEDMGQGAGRKMCRSLTPLGLGVMNFSRNRKKAVITLVSLALGGILFMTAASYISSFDKTGYARQGYFKDAEFNIQYSIAAIELDENGTSGLQAQDLLGEGMVQKLCALDGVTKVREIKGLGVQFDYPEHEEYVKEDIVYPLSREELEDAQSYLEEGSADYEKLINGDYILVADNGLAEEIYGWKFAVGDALTLHYYDGSRSAERKVAILGVLDERYAREHSGSFEGWFLMPEEAVGKLVSFDCLNTHLLVSSREDKEEEVGEILTEMMEEEPELDLETLEERRIDYDQSANQQFGMIGGLSLFIMMFSMLSMINTLITNIVTRKQELAMLESIGMDKGQIRIMLLGESLFLVFVTVGITMTAGTACGYALSRELCHMGAFYMSFRFPGVFALAYTAVLAFVPLVITVVSMGSFSREPLVERLRGSEN